MDLEEMLKKIEKELKESFSCEAIVLFGSYARNTQNKDSDIDIAFKSKKTISKKEIFKVKLDLEEILGIDVDLVDLEKIDDDFCYEILMNGKEIYCIDRLKFDLYKLDKYHQYLDLNESRQPIIERIKKGGTIYGK